MRIVAGKYRHRQIEMTNLSTTRETQDKVRGAIFNMIGPYFDGGSALDLFAGSGAMAIEAYSRGIEKIDLNDIEPQAIAICKKNCSSLGISNANFTCLDYKKFLEATDRKWDIIFLDPPYKMNDIEGILVFVYSHLSLSGKVVFELSTESNYPQKFKSLSLIKDKTYGIKRVLIYQCEGEVYEV